MVDHWRQRGKLVIISFFLCNMPSGGKLFINFLLLMLLCRQSLSQKEKIGKQLNMCVMFSSAWHNSAKRDIFNHISF